MDPRTTAVLATATVAAVLLSSCAQAVPTPAPTIPSAAEAVQSPLPPTATPTITPTVTPEPSPTPTKLPRLVVSQNTHCRSGPAAEYPSLGVLDVGDVADVVGRSPEPGFWFVTGSNLPKEGCWIWGEFAKVDGETETVAVFTPAPSPTPEAGFNVYVRGFPSCNSTRYVVFAVKNVGGKRFWSGYVEIQDFATRQTLYRATERHPFAATYLPACPFDHGNELWPGETRYVHGEIPGGHAGSTAIGIITLCTADYQGDWCIPEYSYFTIP